MIFRALKELEEHISVSMVHPDMLDKGWTFEKDDHGIGGDDLFGFDYAQQVYTNAAADFTGRVTVPILWDKKRETIVANESSEIIRMFNSAFDEVGAKPGDYYPDARRAEIDRVNDRIYDTLNNNGHVNIIHNFPWYWRCVKSKFDPQY